LGVIYGALGVVLGREFCVIELGANVDSVAAVFKPPEIGVA